MKSSLNATKKLTITAVLMAMNIVMSSSILSIAVPGGHMYLNDVIIVTAAVLLEPFYALIVGGVGAFIGDLLFYPTPMFVSLVTHGLQAFVISLFIRKVLKEKPQISTILAAIIGLIITVTGYSLGRAFIYSTPEYALLKLPFQILQTAVGSAIAWVLCWPLGLVKLYHRMFPENQTV